MDGEHRGGVAQSLLSFARTQAEQILPAWIDLARANGSALEEPAALIELVLAQIAARRGDSSFWSSDAHRRIIGLAPAELRQALGLLRSCVLELWAKEVGPRVSIAELQEFEHALEQVTNEGSTRRPRLREAEHSAWMADSDLTRGDVLNIVSHDLRSPLGAILLSANAIAASSEDDDRRRRQCEIIIRAAKHMNRLVNDLLDLSKTGGNRQLSVEKTLRDGADLAQQTVETFGPLAETRRITLLLDTERAPCSLLCDSDRLKQILSNLLGNAIKFTGEGGTVTLRVRARPDEEVVFSVIDTGIGIAAEQLPLVFQPYLQGREAHQGLGLGLSVARALVRAHGGRIWAESVLGQGSTFFVALPAVQAADLDWAGQAIERWRREPAP